MAVQTKNQTIEAGIATLEFSRGATIKLLESIPPDARVLCPVKGANHATWIAGHIALTDNYFFKTVGGQSGALPESWESLFGMGSKCVSSSDAYPAWDEIIAAMHERRAALIDWFGAMSADELAEPLSDDLREFAPNRAALMPAIAWHEGFHAGQLTAVRRSLGMESMFG